MWYFKNLKESFCGIFDFKDEAQGLISTGLLGWISYPFALLLTIGIFTACLFGYDYYFSSPKKAAEIESFGKFKDDDRKPGD